jgi:hypothetical protein
MKRPVYEIAVEGMPPARKNAWNSSLRQMEAMIRESLQRGQTATKTTLSVVKRDPWTHESGAFVWSVSDGRTLAANITLVSPGG